MATLFLTLVLLKYESAFSFCTNNQLTYSYFYLALCGFLMSIGVVVPGVSSTVILMLLGIYPIYLESVSFFNLSVLIPMGIGLIIGCILWLKVIQYLLNFFYIPTFFSIIGFVIGSIFILYPGISLDFTGVSSILLFFICMYLSFKLESKSLKKD